MTKHVGRRRQNPGGISSHTCKRYRNN